MNAFELRQALSDIEEKQRIADDAAHIAARLLIGRLRHVPAYRLRELKKELSKFNMHTGNWSDK